MRRALPPILATLFTLSAFATAAGAHSGALEVENPVNGEKCYVYSGDFGFTQYYIETNHVGTRNGTVVGAGDLNHQLTSLGLFGTYADTVGNTSLQRSSVDWNDDGDFEEEGEYPADEQVPQREWLTRCTAGA